jgi:lipopolysaccharide transport system ATP-binding protein
VGDVFFRNKCYTRLDQLRDAGTAVLLVSHSMPDIEQYCERAVLLDHGVTQFIGPSSEAAKRYYLLHQADTRPAEVPIHPEAVAHPIDGADLPVADRPSPNAYIDLANKAQVSDGKVRCVGVAVCDEAGEPCNTFRQGDVAVLYYEFELLERVGIPLCGVVVRNERGLIVYGKNSWQYDNDVPPTYGPGSRILCRHEIKLDLGLGEYLFEVGCASLSPEIWSAREKTSHEKMNAECMRHCHVPDAGSFSVGLAMKNGVSVLTHHGVANLSGDLVITTVPSAIPSLG